MDHSEVHRCPKILPKARISWAYPETTQTQHICLLNCLPAGLWPCKCYVERRWCCSANPEDPLLLQEGHCSPTGTEIIKASDCDKFPLCFLFFLIFFYHLSLWSLNLHPNNVRHANQHNEFLQHARLDGINCFLKKEISGKKNETTQNSLPGWLQRENYGKPMFVWIIMQWNG